MRRFAITLAVLLAITASAQAQKIDEAYNAKIKEYTTDPRFLPSSVLNVVDDPKIPSPLKHFGTIIGAPGVMHHTQEIYAYFKKLTEVSPLIKMEQIGTSEEGRPFQLVTISSEENLKRLYHYKKQLALLSDPRRISGDVSAIINDSKPVYYFNAGLHSPEMGSPEMVMELAYRLITDQSPEIKDIINNVIILINPASEADGRDKQVDWYYRYTKGRKVFEEDGFPWSPPYWGKYVFHDNNRDGLQVSQQLTKAVFKVYFDWHPTVMHDLHESVPLLYVSTGTGPYNETIDPIAIGEWQIMANHDVTTLSAQGLPGTFHWAFYDGWNPGYLLWIANNHNAIGRFYETFGNAGADTYLRDLGNEKYAGDAVTSREWYRPDPATEKVLWSSRNNVNYMQAGVLASLNYTSDNAKLLLKNYYQKGANAIRKGKEDKPKAYVIPQKQKDPYMAAYMVNQLKAQGIEVHQSNSGDYVVLLDQPYRNFAVSLLSKQNFPKEAKFAPYDDIAWTMNYQLGVDVKAEDTLKYSPSDLKLITGEARYEGKIDGDGSNYVVNYKAQNTVLSALYWAKSKNAKSKAFIIDTKTTVDGVKDTLGAGSVIFSGLTSDQAKSIASQFGLDLATTKADIAKKRELKLPRIAIYHDWIYTQDEGWTRFTFEQRGIPYTSIDKDDLKAGALQTKYDVIVIPRTYGEAADFIHGVDKKWGPMPYTKTAEFPSHGYPDATPDMTGGPGFDGVGNLKTFVDNGGVLITFDNSSKMVAEAGITRSLQNVSLGSLFHPGSVVNVKARKSGHPVLYGYPENFHLFRGNGPLLQVDKFSRDMMLVQYGSEPLKDEKEYKGLIMGMPDRKEIKAEEKKETKETPYLISGMVRNESTIVGHGAVFSVPVGKGNLVAFTFDPMHRYQNLHEAPMVFNALINWEKLR